MQSWKIRIFSLREASPGVRLGYKAASMAILRSLVRLGRMAGRGASTLPLGEPARDENGLWTGS